jgi:hypothetical protein
MKFVRERNGEYLTQSSIELKGILFVDHVAVKESLVDDVIILNYDFKEKLRQFSMKCQPESS